MDNFILGGISGGGEAHILKKSADIIKYTGDLVLQEIKSGQKVAVIFPHRRPAYFLGKYISGAYNISTDAVEMFSIDDFIDKCWESSAPSVFPPFPKINSAEAAFIIFDLNNNKETRLIKNAEKLDVFMPWGYKLFGDFEELLIESADPASCDGLIAEKIDPGLNIFNFPDKFAKFSKMYKLFYETLSERGFCSRSYRYKSIAENTAENPAAGAVSSFLNGRRVILAAFYGITAAESVIFKNLLKNKNSGNETQACIVSKTGAGITDFLKKIGLEPPEEKNGIINGGGNKYNGYESEYAQVKFYFNKVSSVHNEIMRLKETIKQSENKLSSKDLIVLSKEDYLFPLLHNLLNSLNKEEYNVSIGYSLKRTPIYTLFNLMSVLHGRKKNGKFYAKDYISLFLHPYVKNISGKLKGLPQLDFNAVRTRTLFQSIEYYIKINKILFISVKDIENIEPVSGGQNDMKAYLSEMHRIFISDFENIENIKDFIEKIIKIIDAVSHNSAADKHPYGSKFIESALKSVMEFGAESFSAYKFEGISGYFNLLKSILKRQKVPFAGTPVKGLQVLGPLEARTINFDRVYYLGANEGTLPDVSKEDTVLTEDVRKFLKIPAADESSRMQEYNFFNLISAAKEVHFFYKDSSSSEKSRFIEKIIWDIQKKTKNLKEPKETNSAFKINFIRKEPSPIEKTEEVKEYLCGIDYSAAKLDAYLKCPSMFYYRYVLNMSESEEVGEDIDAPGVGNVIHAVLKEYFEKFLYKEYRISDSENEKAEIYGILGKNFNCRGSKVLNLQKRQMFYALGELIEARRKELSGATITGVEYPMETFITAERCAQKIKLAGRADLIFEKDGEHFIIDYKTGGILSVPDKKFIPAAGNREEWLKNVKSVQLPFYIMLYCSHKGVGHSNVSAKLWGLKKGREYSIDLKDGGSFNSYAAFIEMLTGEIINSDYFDCVKKESGKKICGYCPYYVLCGRI